MLKSWRAWVMIVALAAAGYVGWQSYFEEPTPQSALERTQLVLENATISRFEGNGAPSEHVRFDALHYQNPESALAHGLQGYSRPQQLDDFDAQTLRYEPKRFVSEEPVHLTAQKQQLHAQAARYELNTRQLYLTQPVIDYVP